MIKTYTYKIKPNKNFEQEFEEWIGTCRYVYNVAIETREESYKKGVSINYYDLSRQLTEAKKEFEWIRKVSSGTLQDILQRLENGYKRFFKDLKQGKKTSKPKWATKDKWKSIPFKTIKAKEKYFTVPNLGPIKVFKYKIPKGELRTASIVKEADGLYLKVVVIEYPRTKHTRENQSMCSVDMGIVNFLTTSDREVIENPKHLSKYLTKLRVENRKLSRMKKGGKNFKKQKRKLQKLHLKVSRVRKDFLHKQSTMLSSRYSTVIREDLNISKMLQNKNGLAVHISDCSWGLFFELLEYKTNVIKVNPLYSSQECSKCGNISKENRKTQSLFDCTNCGFLMNADKQACLNLLKRGQTLLHANVSQ